MSRKQTGELIQSLKRRCENRLAPYFHVWRISYLRFNMIKNKFYIFFVLAIFANQAEAEVFKCKDNKGKIIYQEHACQNETIDKLKIMPGPPIEEQIRAQAREDKMRQDEAAKKAAEEIARKELEKKYQAEILERQQTELLKRQQQEEQHRRLQAEERERRKMELLERQATAAEAAAYSAAQAARSAADARLQPIRNPIYCTPNSLGGLNCY